MKKILGFLFKTLVGGFFVLLPVFLIYLLIGELLDALIALATPITVLLPPSVFGGADTDEVVAALLLIVVCLMAGLAMQTRTGEAIGRWLEQRILERIPGYSVLRGISRQFAGDHSEQIFRPAVVQSSPAIQTPALVIEEHSDGDYTVLMPIAPTPGIGTVQIVKGELVRKSGLSTPEAMDCFLQWGVGAEKLKNNLEADDGSSR
jgi:uncharacterized membrane protein